MLAGDFSNTVSRSVVSEVANDYAKIIVLTFIKLSLV